MRVSPRVRSCCESHKTRGACSCKNIEERTNQKLADMEKKIDKLVRKLFSEDATTEEPDTTPALEAEGILDQITESVEL